jgi:AmmeMemoRadiSam system protein B
MIISLDPRGLYQVVMEEQISMCGVVPTTIVMLAAMELGVGRAELIRYTDSGEVSGDIDQVVGYAGMIMV